MQERPTGRNRGFELIPGSRKPPTPRWIGILVQMAQDKHHDLIPGSAKYWRLKLEAGSYRDEEICQALLAYSGEFFPSVDDIVALIQQRRDLPDRGKFKPCLKNGCVAGWVLADERRVRRCKCLADYIGEGTLTHVADDEEKRRWREWEQFKFDAKLPAEMTYQQYWVRENSELVKQLAARLDMNAGKPHPKAKELLELRKQGVTGKAAYKVLDTSPSGRPYQEHFRE